MVNKDIIIKTLNEAIHKCSGYRVGNLSLGNKTKQTLNRFRNKTKDYDYEAMQFINTNGEVVLERDNKPTDDRSGAKVDFTDLNFDEMAENGDYDLIITHNHPGAYWEYKYVGDIPKGDGFYSKKQIATILSLDDCLQVLHTATLSNGEMVTPFKGIVAECPNGSRMSLIRRKDYDVDNITGKGNNTKQIRYQILFENAYEVLHNKWKHYLEDYDQQLKIHMHSWSKNHYENRPKWWNDRDKKNEMYYKEKTRFSKTFNKEHFNEKYLSDIIETFDNLGFELSVEWSN